MAARTRGSSREVACDFFQVDTGAGASTDFIQIINSIYAARTEAVQRNVTIEDSVLRMYNWRVTDGNASGALLRLRRDASASIGRLSSDDLRDISLRPDEALAEYFCFSYFSEFRVLVVHRNRYAGSHTRLEYYLQRMHQHRPIQFRPVMTTDALRRLDRMGDITIATVKLALPTGNQPYDTGNEATTEMVRLGHRTGAVTLSLKVSVDHSRGILNRDVKEIWQHIVSQFTAHSDAVMPSPDLPPAADTPTVEEATLHGYKGYDSDELITIDLIAERMQERVTVRTATSRASLDELQSATQLAYERRQEELRDQFGNGHGP